MRNILIIIFLAVLQSDLLAQKQIEITEPLNNAKKIVMNFKHPDLIKIHSWDKKQIRIAGFAMINQGENDDKFKLTTTSLNSTIHIDSEIVDYDQLPRRIVISHNGKEYYFNTSDWNSPEILKFKNDHNGKCDYSMSGVVKKIELDIYVPKNIAMEISAKYGLVEIKNLDNTVSVNAKYGGIDVAFSDSMKNAIKVSTKFGQVFSNLNYDFKSEGSNRNRDWMTLSTFPSDAKNHFNLESKYGNVYLREM